MRSVFACLLSIFLCSEVGAASVAVELRGTIKIDSSSRWVPPELQDGDAFTHRATIDDQGAISKIEFFSGDTYISGVSGNGPLGWVGIDIPTLTQPGGILLIYGGGNPGTFSHENFSLPEASLVGLTPDNLPPRDAYIEDFQHGWPTNDQLAYAGPRDQPTNALELATLFSEFWNQEPRSAAFFMLFTRYFFEVLTPEPGPHGPDHGYWVPTTELSFFKLENITARAAVVPLPAAFPLLAGGLLFFSWVGWRQKHIVTR
ncbi:hypothetical protein [uncultured Roseibium sp.]|uniref:hypothetical protein n=1 Tax=uncultured Roseibium sp. TaxID=1936171 RepID=UPI0026037ED7|nr:hypothetical protein [uncultured Roseibium sp.]